MDQNPVIDFIMAQNPCRSEEMDLNWSVVRIIKYIACSPHLTELDELVKSEIEAFKHREAGNRFYRERNLVKAMDCYNQSICYAQLDSEQLGMGYANRSAVCLEQGDYEYALFNIDLAKKHNYPEKQMPKLLVRERNCKQRIADGHSKGTVPSPRINLNVNTNPRIPFLANGIAMTYDSRFGRGLIAEKDFNVGDMILDEKIELGAHNFFMSYLQCNQCFANYSQLLIPCPTCVLFMYCSKECRELSWKLYHRFECGVASKLCCVSGSGDMIFPRLFFYGLSQFGDDLQAMMEYCEKKVSRESNPLDVDYTNLDRLDVFKTLHNTHRRKLESSQGGKRGVASYYVVYLMNPAVRSIIRTESHRRFFLRSLLLYSSMLYPLATTHSIDGHLSAVVRPIGSLLNHSCDPHAIQTFDSGRWKVILIRPVQKGEQIFMTYGPAWWQQTPAVVMTFKCQCVVCDQGKAGQEWHSLKMRQYSSKALLKDMRVLNEIFEKDDVHIAARLIALQQFIKRYAHYHPNATFLAGMLQHYSNFLTKACTIEEDALVRAKLQAKFV
uniref:SET and MYND domain-containing protein 4 n=1 Tax=Culex tarsalis TaxID=7177 RepID=A0A1Q3EXI8_CULTA